MTTFLYSIARSYTVVYPRMSLLLLYIFVVWVNFVILTQLSGSIGGGGGGVLLYKALCWYIQLASADQKEYIVWCRYSRITLGSTVRGWGIEKGRVITLFIFFILFLHTTWGKRRGGREELWGAEELGKYDAGATEMEFMEVQFRWGFWEFNLRFLRLEVSTLVFVFLQNVIHGQTCVFFIDWLFCVDFWHHRGGMVFC
jgi:hypothetical protein